MPEPNTAPAPTGKRRPDRTERELGDAIMEAIALMRVVGTSESSPLHRRELLRVARRLATAVGLEVGDPGEAN